MKAVIDFIYGGMGGMIIALIWYIVAGVRGHFK